MNIPELKVFPLNNADVITASGPVPTKVGYFFGSFYDSDDNENYYIAKDNGTIEKFAWGDTSGALYGKEAVLKAFDLTTAADLDRLIYAYFEIKGERLYGKDRFGLQDLQLMYAAGGHYASYPAYTSKEQEIDTFSNIFNQHMWSLVDKDGSFTFVAKEGTYSFDDKGWRETTSG